MRLGARLFNILTGDATVFGLIGSKIHPQLAPEGEAPPFVVYTVVHASPLVTFDGADTTRRVLVQLSCYARHYGDVHALADAIEAVITTRMGAGLSMSDGPIFDRVMRRDLPAEAQPQWYHVAIDASGFTIDT